jgi:predicted ATPase
MIAQIVALNYKCLCYIDQRLHPFQVLVGPNASGKSTFLDVVAFLGDMLQEGPERAVLNRAPTIRELIWKQKSEEFQLAIEFQVPKDLQAAVQKNGEEYTRCRYEVNIGVDPRQGGIRQLGENFFLMRESNRSSQEIQRDLFPQNPTSPSTIMVEKHRRTPPGWKKVLTLTEEGRAYFRSETTKWMFPLRPGPQKAALAMIPEEEERFPISNWARRVLTEGVQVLSFNSRAMRQPCSPSAPRTFQPDGSNLPLVIRELQNKPNSRYQDWLGHLQTVLPDLAELKVIERPEDRHLYVVATYTSGVKVPSWLISDGTLRFLALTLLAYLPSEGRTYLIEEPENGIHPRAVEAVFQSLSSVYGSQVLLATHSPLILGLAQRDQMLCFNRTPDGATDIVTGTEHPALRDWQGQINLGILYASGVLG